MVSRQWIVSQIGAREHYAVPRALHHRGVLSHLYTDAWCSLGHSILRRLPNPIRSLANRYHPELPAGHVTAFTVQAVKQRIDAYLKDFAPGSTQYYDHHRQVGADFARKVQETIAARSIDLANTVFFGYNTGSLETLEWLDDSGCLTLVDQIDPGRVEKEIVRAEAERWSDWVVSVPEVPKSFEERVAAEWSKADIVVVNSSWSKHALIEQNVPSEKIRVVPLAYEPPVTFQPKKAPDLPLELLWLGSVNLRKGIPYLMEAAHRLRNAPVHFNIVGPIRISDDAVASAPSNVTFTGRVPRDETGDWYRQADVFVLPTLSDGFAITQLEAMAHGLPVIATPNCGQVVTDGEDGFIVPPRDVDALTATISRLVDDPAQIEALSARALETSKTFTLDRVADRLTDIVAAYDATDEHPAS